MHKLVIELNNSRATNCDSLSIDRSFIDNLGLTPEELDKLITYTNARQSTPSGDKVISLLTPPDRKDHLSYLDNNNRDVILLLGESHLTTRKAKCIAGQIEKDFPHRLTEAGLGGISRKKIRLILSTDKPISKFFLFSSQIKSIFGNTLLRRKKSAEEPLSKDVTGPSDRNIEHATEILCKEVCAYYQKYHKYPNSKNIDLAIEYCANLLEGTIAFSRSAMHEIDRQEWINQTKRDVLIQSKLRLGHLIPLNIPGQNEPPKRTYVSALENLFVLAPTILTFKIIDTLFEYPFKLLTGDNLSIAITFPISCLAFLMSLKYQEKIANFSREKCSETMGTVLDFFLSPIIGFRDRAMAYRIDNYKKKNKTAKIIVNLGSKHVPGVSHYLTKLGWKESLEIYEPIMNPQKDL